MIQIAITPTGLRYHEAELPPQYGTNIHTVIDSTGRMYCWCSYDTGEPDYEERVSFVVTAPFDESKSGLDVIAVIPPPPLFEAMYGSNPTYGCWFVFGYVDANDDFYATVCTENLSEERLYRWDWGTNQWVDLPGWVQISELGWSFTYFIKPNKPLGWVALGENKVANVFADGNVVTTSNNVITAVGPYVYTYNPFTWAIEIFSPEKNSTTLGEPIAIHDLERQLRDPGYGNWNWTGTSTVASLAPGDFSIVFYHYYDNVALEINLEWVKEYYQFDSGSDRDSAFYYLGQPSDSAKPRFWTNLIGCTEKP